ncbi:MAG: N-acetylglucosamine-specific PTS transporter subunit IIBC [Neisseriaceae bacterium]|nr:N-acetylglucosamine-specific PTS transporter subunit IIBC [Neisseriaceae bacterium]
MRFLGYLQKIGRALMVPVATLPAAAILMGIGYWIDPQGWGGGSPTAGFLIKAGAAIIDNMALLFAVGVAYGMSKDKDGSAALSGLVGWLVLTTLLAPDTIAMLKGIKVDEVAPAFGKIKNQFVGILIGVITAELYNYYSKVNLHSALAFFSGRRLVPIVVSVAMIFVSLILYFVWPFIFNVLVGFGEGISKLGAVGAGIYGFLNRLLIPIGLHHALNSVFWFDVAGINDIPNFMGGQASIDAGKAILGETGRYQAGYFPIMMFGLPGAALAIYHTALPAQRAKIGSLMIAAAFASFFTGVTEPLEFAFMFVAPVLYFIHAVLTGISVFIAAQMHWMAGFGFSAGLVDLVLSSQNPLATHLIMLVTQGLVFFAIYYFIFRFTILKLNLKTPGRDENSAQDESEETIKPVTNDTNLLAQSYIDMVGGFSNITEIDACTTRLRLILKDTNQVNKNKAQALGASGVMVMDARNVQIIVGLMADSIASNMQELFRLSDTHKEDSGIDVLQIISTTELKNANVNAHAWQAALGGSANIVSVKSSAGNRLLVVLKNKALAQESELLALGAAGFVSTGDDTIQVLLKENSQAYANAIQP